MCLAETGGLEVRDAIVGVTPDFANGKDQERGDEIAAWMEGREIESFVIVDDDMDMGDLVGRLVRTNVFGPGLDAERADEVIRLFKNPKGIANNENVVIPPLTIVAKEQPSDEFVIIYFNNGECETFDSSVGIMDVQFGEDWLEFAMGDGTNQRWELDGPNLSRVS
jgi:hypothetical protein